MAANRSTGRTRERRRQRSVRVTVAVTLLAVATAAVVLALPTQSPTFLSAAAIGAVVLGWASVRMVWTEVLQSRRENAADRAAAAHAYRSLFTERAAEHAEFTTAMTERLAASNLSLRELQGALVAAEHEGAQQRVRAESAEAGMAGSLQRIVELQASLDILTAEREKDSVEDLLAFNEKVTQAVGKHAAEDAKLA